MTKKKKKPTAQISAKQKTFIDNYVLHYNGTKAALDAGYSKQTAHSYANQLLEKPHVKAYLKKMQDKAAAKLETSHEGILNRLKQWADSDITQTIGLTPEEVKNMPLAFRQLITKYKSTTKTLARSNDVVQTIEVEFVSKEKALEMINKHVGFYEADNRQKASEINLNDLSNEVLLALSNAKRK